MQTFVHPTALLTRDRVRVFALVGPLAVWSLGLKTVRIFDHPDRFISTRADALRGLFRLMASDLFAQVGYGLLVAAILALAGRRRATLGTLFAQLLSLAIFVASTAAHLYFSATGNGLDFPLLAVTLTHLREVSPLASAAMAPAAIGGVLIMVLALVAFPWVAPRLAPPSPEPRLSLRRAFATLSLAALSLSLALLPAPKGEDSAVTTDPALHLLRTGTRSWTPAGNAEPGALSALDVAIAPQGARKKNLVVVVLESTRDTATTVYSPNLPTTPFLASVAARGLVVEGAHAVVPHTSKSLPAILCGIEPALTTRSVAAMPGKLPARCLPKLLKSQGYATAFFSSAAPYENRAQLMENVGVDRFESTATLDTTGFEKTNGVGVEDEVMLAPIEEYVRAHRNGPFFLGVLTSAPHYEYLAPSKRHGRVELDSDDLKNRYLNAVRNEDFFLKDLFDVLKRSGTLEQTLVVLVGDHGEAFGEHALFGHDDAVYEESLKVPLVFFDGSGQLPHARIQGPASHVDVAPTVLGLLGYRITQGALPGRDLLSARSHERPVYGACYDDEKCFVRIGRKFKYIHRPHGDDELFAIGSDAAELRNVAAQHPELVQRFREELERWRRGVGARYATPWLQSSL